MRNHRRSEVNATVASYLISITVHCVIVLLLALLLGRVAGRAAGTEAKEYYPVDVVYVPGAVEAPAGAEAQPSVATEETGVLPEVSEVQVEEKIQERAAPAEAEREGKTAGEAQAAGEEEAAQEQPAMKGDEGVAEMGAGVRESPFPTGAFGAFEVYCSKTDENRGVSGESYFEAVFRDGALSVIPDAGRLVGDTTTIKKAVWFIQNNFSLSALGAEPGGVYRGTIRCSYDCAGRNVCVLE
ncbi:MAG: hypothetical protein AB1742_10670 [bacterium]